MRRIFIIFVLFTALFSPVFAQDDLIILDSNISLHQFISELDTLKSEEVISRAEKYSEYARQSDRFGLLLARAYCNCNLLQKSQQVLDMLPVKSKHSYFIQFLVYFLQFKFTEAQKVLKEAEIFARNPLDKELLVYTFCGYAELEIGKGNLDAAAAYIKKAIDTGFNASYLQYVMQRLEYVKGDIEKTEKLIADYQASSPPDKFIYTYLAEIALRKKDLSAAEANLKKADEVLNKAGRLWCDGVVETIGYNLSAEKPLSVFEEFPLELDREKFVLHIYQELKAFSEGSFKSPLKFSRDLLYVIQAYASGKIKFTEDELRVALPVLYTVFSNLYIFQREIPPDHLIKLLNDTSSRLASEVPACQEISAAFRTAAQGVEDYIHKDYGKALTRIDSLAPLLDAANSLPRFKAYLEQDTFQAYYRIVGGLVKSDPETLARLYLKITGKTLVIDDTFKPEIYTDEIIRKISIDQIAERVIKLHGIFYHTFRGDCLFELGKTKDALLSYAEARKLNPVIFASLKAEVDRRYANLNPENFFYDTGRDISDLFCEISLYYLRLDDVKSAVKVIERGMSVFPDSARIKLYGQTIKSIEEGGK